MEILAVIISVVALAVSIMLSLNARRREEAVFDGVFWGQYSQIHNRMDIRYRDDAWTPPVDDLAIWGPLEEYWYFCLSEYELTERSSGGVYRNLWRNKIRQRIGAALLHKPLRYVLSEIVSRGSMRGQYAKDFLDEMENIYGSKFLPE